MSLMGDSFRIVEILRAHFGDNGGRMHTAVEVGCHRGETSAKILRAFPNVFLYLVDPYRSYKKDDPYRLSGDSLAKLTSNEQHQHYLAACKATEFARDRRQFCKFPSTAAAKIISAPRLSAAFLDGNHAYEAVRDDIAAWWPRIEARGLFAGHDYGHQREGRGFGVKQAVTEFAEREKLEVGLLGTCWYVVKA